MAEIGGRLELELQPGKGTRVVIEVRVDVQPVIVNNP